MAAKQMLFYTTIYHRLICFSILLFTFAITYYVPGIMAMGAMFLLYVYMHELHI